MRLSEFYPHMSTGLKVMYLLGIIKQNLVNYDHTVGYFILRLYNPLTWIWLVLSLVFLLIGLIVESWVDFFSYHSEGRTIIIQKTSQCQDDDENRDYDTD